MNISGLHRVLPMTETGIKDSFTGWVLALYSNKFQNRTFVFQEMDVHEVQCLESNTAFEQRLQYKQTPIHASSSQSEGTS